jgi:hypothetical protein
MELKDVILSTLAEMEESNDQVVAKPEPKHLFFEKEEKMQEEAPKEPVVESSTENELLFLHAMRERLLVLFEGFQSPNNANIEAKVDLTLNFLEYLLATTDERLEKIKKGKRA